VDARDGERSGSRGRGENGSGSNTRTSSWSIAMIDVYDPITTVG